MSIQESTPGVYINEFTGPGVIQGVGTSTAAFIGPTIAGPPLQPTPITNFDQFASIFGNAGAEHHPHLVDAGGRLHHMSLCVLGFFQNGGTAAFIVRVDNSILGDLALLDREGNGTTVATVRATSPTVSPTISVVDLTALSLDLVFFESTVDAAPANPSPIAGDATNDLLVADASGFEVGDRVITDGAVRTEIVSISGNWVRPSVALNAAGDLLIAPLDSTEADATFRVTASPEALRVGSLLTLANPGGEAQVLLTGVDGNRLTTTVVTNDVDLSGNDTTVSPAVYAMAAPAAAITAVAGLDLTLDDASGFAAGDTVTDGAATATIITVDPAMNVITVDNALPVGPISIADLPPDRTRFRLQDTRGLRPGTVLYLEEGGNDGVGIVSSISTSGIVTLADSPPRTATIGAGGTATPIEFSVIVATPDEREEPLRALSMNPTASNYLFTAFDSDSVTMHPPEPPLRGTPEQLTPLGVTDAPLSAGTVGEPANLGLPDYEAALAKLARVDDVNIVTAPDAASISNADVRRAVHQAMITHCLDEADRIAVIDPPVDLAPSGPGSIEEFRGDVQSERGFAALYYPWVRILDPTAPSSQPRTIFLPPSGHVAGVMARVDAERGVFKAPANVPIRNVLGVERRITDREQAPLNRGGTNVLRILPGNNEVTVWGARTTVDPAITDWIYVSVRRLLLFIEESVQESIRWAVFEPNDHGLWKSLERVIRAFLRQQWRDGALFGLTEDEAFLVRIDEGLNPPEVRNIGRLNIEIRVAPVRPAEFIVITIGLFDGGAEIAES